MKMKLFLLDLILAGPFHSTEEVEAGHLHLHYAPCSPASTDPDATLLIFLPLSPYTAQKFTFPKGADHPKPF